MSKTNNNSSKSNSNDNFIKTESSSDASALSRFKDLNLSSEQNDVIENTHLPEYIRIKAVGQGKQFNCIKKIIFKIKIVFKRILRSSCFIQKST